jgi:hypothetical protein
MQNEECQMRNGRLFLHRAFQRDSIRFGEQCQSQLDNRVFGAIMLNALKYDNNQGEQREPIKFKPDRKKEFHPCLFASAECQRWPGGFCCVWG